MGIVFHDGIIKDNRLRTDDRALADAMMRFAESPDLRLRIGRAGLDLARRELGFDRKMELMLSSYRRAIRRTS